MGAAWPYQDDDARGEPALRSPSTIPTGGCYRLGRHVDARHQGAASELRLQVDAVHVDAEDPGARTPISFGETPANTQACSDHGQDLEGLLRRATTPTSRQSYFNTIKFWKTPLATCDNGKNDCVPFQKWVTAWTQIIG